METPAHNQCSERKSQDTHLPAIIIGAVYVGKRQGWLSWAKRHWGWSLYTEVNVLSHQDAYKLLFSGLCRMATLPCLYVLSMLCFPCLWKEGIFMPNLPSPERKTCWECLSRNGKSLNQTRPPQSRGSQLFTCHNYRRMLGGKKQIFTSWVKKHLSWCSFTNLIILLNQEASKLLFVVFVKWIFFPGSMN